MAPKPDTVWGLMQEWEMLGDKMQHITVDNPVYLSGILLVACTLGGGLTQGTCYDNVFADVFLKNGNPPANSLLAHVDLFSW